jgi:hypothetical protein
MVNRVSSRSTSEGCSERNTLRFVGSHVRKRLLRSFASDPEQGAGSDNRTARAAATSRKQRKPNAGQELEWRAQADDFRTFLSDFVSAVAQVEILAGISL